VRDLALHHTHAVAALDGCRVPQHPAEYSVPARIGDCTDFCTSTTTG